MTYFKETVLELDHVFDKKSSRHYLNGAVSVFHCHHYTTLYTQLAMDAQKTELLKDVSEESFYHLLVNYYETNGIDLIDERINIACQYYGAVGLGKMEVKFLGDDSGEVVVFSSHVDQGWIKKWGKHDAPVNYITAGYIQAVFSAVLDLPMGVFDAREIESIVMGAKESLFKVVKK